MLHAKTVIQLPRLRVYYHYDRRDWSENSLLIAVKPIQKVYFKHLTWPWKLTERVRRVLPYFMYVSYFDCDSARYFSGHPYFAVNYWHLNKVRAGIDYLSDGTSHSKMSVIGYIKARIELFKINSTTFNYNEEY